MNSLIFLHSKVLWALFAALIPVILHLLHRKRLTLIPFSDLKWLAALTRQRMSRFKIQEWFLLLLRTLILILLILIFARPSVKKSTGQFQTASPVHIVILLDHSYSMGVQWKDWTLFEKAKIKCNEILDQLPAGSQANIIVFEKDGHPLYPDLTGQLNLIKENLSSISLSQGRSNLPTAFSEALQILEKLKSANKEIYILSDFQEPLEEIIPLSKQCETLNIRRYWIPINSPDIANLSIEKIDFADPIFESNKEMQLSALIKNQGSTKSKDVSAYLFIDQSKKGQQKINLDPGEQKTFSFHYSLNKPGFHNGFIELEDDDLELDNKRYFSINLPEKIELLLVSENITGPSYLEKALRPDPQSPTLFRLKSILTADLSKENLLRYDVLILNDISRLPSSMSPLLQHFIKAKKGLFLILGPHIDIKYFNNELLPLLQISTIIQHDQFSKSESSFLTFNHVQNSPYLFSNFQSLNSSQSPKIFQRYLLNTTNPILQLLDGSPLLLANSSARSFVLTSAILPAWNDLYKKGLFVPLIHHAINVLAQNPLSLRTYLVNEKFSLLLNDLDLRASFVLKSPSGEKIQIPLAERNNQLYLEYKNTEISGVYSVLKNEEEYFQFSVNPDVQESQRFSRSDESLQRIFNLANEYVLDQAAPLSITLQKSRLGREFGRTLMWGVFIALIVEAFLCSNYFRQITLWKYSLSHANKFIRLVFRV